MSAGFLVLVEVVDDKIIVQKEINQSVSSDEQIIVQDEIIIREKFMEPLTVAFVEELLHETDVICPICEGTSKDYFHDDCALCDVIGKLLEYGDERERHDDESEDVYAIGDKKPKRYGSTDSEWQKIRFTLDPGSTVDVMPNDELCQVEAGPCKGSRANRIMFAANGTKIDSKRNKVQSHDRRGIPFGLRVHLRSRQEDPEFHRHHM